MTQREVLASAISYALQGAALVTPASLDWPTPCAEWDVRTLLLHLASSITTIEEALSTGLLGPEEAPATAPDPVELLRDRAAALLVTTFLSDCQTADIAGVPVPAELIRGTGALETAVHGWDIYVACGQRRPVPPGIANPLLGMLGRLIPARDGLFDGPVAAPPCASPGDRLVAALGRNWTRPVPGIGYPRVALAP